MMVNNNARVQLRGWDEVGGVVPEATYVVNANKFKEGQIKDRFYREHLLDIQHSNAGDGWLYNTE